MSNCTYWLGHGTGCLRSYSLPVKSVCDWVLEGSGRGILSFLSVLERVWIEKDRGLVLHIPPLASPSPCSLSLHPSFLPPGPPVSGWINPPGPSSHNPFDYPHFTVPSCELCAGISLCLELKAGFGSAVTDNLQGSGDYGASGDGDRPPSVQLTPPSSRPIQQPPVTSSEKQQTGELCLSVFSVSLN
ncbi:hypothetical protein F2P79_010084 [Pimephales promelas]|nr:hypothetical protein F2P79_010084 [Pimephales promelas]